MKFGMLLQGYKMYLLLGAGAVVVLVNHFVGTIPGIEMDSSNWLEDLYGLALIATGAAKAGRIEKKLQ